MAEPELPPTSPTLSQAKQVTFLKAFLLVVLTYITTAILLDYSAHFVHPEMPHAYPTFFRNGPGPAVGDLKLMFNVPLFSPASRPRALSQLVEIYNGKLRIWLAHYFPPHPSFSHNRLNSSRNRVDRRGSSVTMKFSSFFSAAERVQL